MIFGYSETKSNKDKPSLGYQRLTWLAHLRYSGLTHRVCQHATRSYGVSIAGCTGVRGMHW